MESVGGVDTIFVPSYARGIMLLYVGGERPKDLVKGLGPFDVRSVPRSQIRGRFVGKGKVLRTFLCSL